MAQVVRSSVPSAAARPVKLRPGRAGLRFVGLMLASCALASLVLVSLLVGTLLELSRSHH